jgi:hypothetical protein
MAARASFTAKRGASLALLVVLAIAMVEWVASARSYRSRIDAADFESLPDHDDLAGPIFVAEPWLAGPARMHNAELDDWSEAAPPDLRGLQTFHVLGLDHAWSPRLDAWLEDLPPPRLVESRPVGSLTLHRYELDAAPQVGSLLEWEQAKVRVDGRRCSHRGAQWTCKPHRVRIRNAEIDYQARRCMAFELLDGTSAEVRVEDVELGDTLRGHLGFDDFNARLRSDAPVQLQVLVDGEEVASLVFTDDQGWAPFAVRTDDPGSHDLTIRLNAPTLGTWTRKGYRLRPAHVPCLELRSFLEGPLR